MSAIHVASGRDRLVTAVDLDDTLFAELDYARSALHAAGAEIARQFGSEGIGHQAASLLDSLTPPTLPLQQALAVAGLRLSSDQMSSIVAVMQTHHPEIVPFPEALDALRQLRRFGMLVLVTEGRSTTQRLKIGALQVDDLFDNVFITEEMGPAVTKASGAPYQTVRRAYPAAARFVMIGDDEVKDARPAQQVGFEVALVRRPGVRYVKPLPKRPTHPSLAHAIAALGIGADPARS
jgi:putative hydrolase of the HAD superfamily